MSVEQAGKDGGRNDAVGLMGFHQRRSGAATANGAADGSGDGGVGDGGSGGGGIVLTLTNPFNPEPGPVGSPRPMVVGNNERAW